MDQVLRIQVDILHEVLGVSTQVIHQAIVANDMEQATMKREENSLDIGVPTLMFLAKMAFVVTVQFRFVVCSLALSCLELIVVLIFS